MKAVSFLLALAVLLTAQAMEPSLARAGEGAAGDEPATMDLRIQEDMIEILAIHQRVPEELRRLIARVVVEEARRYELDPYLVLAVIRAESYFDAKAVSPVGAEGLMQIRPFVGRWLAGRMGIPWKGPRPLFDPETNIRLGTYYLADLLGHFGDMNLALTAYNWGPARLSQTLSSRGSRPPEMRTYEQHVWRCYAKLMQRSTLERGIATVS